MVKKILNISWVTKTYKDLQRPLSIFCPQIIMYKRNFDENGHIYFLIKEEEVFIKYMKILEKVIVISSKTNLILNLYIVKNI